MLVLGVHVNLGDGYLDTMLAGITLARMIS